MFKDGHIHTPPTHTHTPSHTPHAYPHKIEFKSLKDKIKYLVLSGRASS